MMMENKDRKNSFLTTSTAAFVRVDRLEHLGTVLGWNVFVSLN